ncbi:hypothetical protein AWB81_08251 [Caballeronia arationis]|uniref:hypothetical protein n=1 Tax=Caballeronia arationis TaxID=1777142 RepID=UPI00074B573D|nr:hypothetical protein [Caballeronia arationis]SAL07719.1 hypothetical protein AWB81_08251 [Caballeronia arationis]
MRNTRKVAKSLSLAGMLLGIVVTTGCASIVGGANQSISLETRTSTGEQIAGVNCKLENPKGTWFVTTPGSVTIHRAYDDLSIYCTKAGEQPGIATVKSSTKGMAFGNILFGGVIGAGVDVATGAAYDYPTLITVQLGATATIAPPTNNAPGTAALAPKGGDTKVTPTSFDGGKRDPVESRTVAATANPS